MTSVFIVILYTAKVCGKGRAGQLALKKVVIRNGHQFNMSNYDTVYARCNFDYVPAWAITEDWLYLNVLKEFE